MDKQINEFPPLIELTDDTIFHVKDGLLDMYATREVVSLGIAEDILVDASTSVKGIVQLNNTTTSTSITQAATANAVKLVADQLATKLSAATEVIAGNGLTGGGALDADVTLTLGTPSTLSVSTSNLSSSTTHTHAVTFPVTSVAGKTGGAITLVADDISNGTTVGKSFLTTANPSAIRFARVNADNTVSYLSASDFRTAIGAGSAVGGTVTSVGVDVPTGFTVTNSPITETGTIEINFDVGYSLPLDSDQTNWDTAYTERNRWDGGATGLVAATGRSSLGATGVGSSFFTTANPSAITFPRVNADNTVSYLNASDFRTAIGAGSGGGSGTVTSVALTTPTGLVVSGSPITNSGTFSITFDTGYSIPPTVLQNDWNTAYTERNSWDGGSTGLVAATGRTSLNVSARSSNYDITGTAYDLDAADDNNYGRTTNAAAKTITVRPNSTHALPTDSTFYFRNIGAGNLTIVAGGGVTINPPQDGTLVVAQHGTVALRKVGINEYDLIGQVVSA